EEVGAAGLARTRPGERRLVLHADVLADEGAKELFVWLVPTSHVEHASLCLRRNASHLLEQERPLEVDPVGDSSCGPTRPPVRQERCKANGNRHASLPMISLAARRGPP